MTEVWKSGLCLHAKFLGVHFLGNVIRPNIVTIHPATLEVSTLATPFVHFSVYNLQDFESCILIASLYYNIVLKMNLFGEETSQKTHFKYIIFTLAVIRQRSRILESDWTESVD